MTELPPLPTLIQKDGQRKTCSVVQLGEVAFLLDDMRIQQVCKEGGREGRERREGRGGRGRGQKRRERGGEKKSITPVFWEQAVKDIAKDEVELHCYCHAY